MIDLTSSSFFLPTKEFRRLSILLAIYHEPRLSQHLIAAKAGLSSAMVNRYVREFEKNGLIEVTSRNRRDRDYGLTEKGRSVLFSLLMSCSAEIVQLYAQARQELVKKFSRLFSTEKQQRIILFGGSDTAAMVIQAVNKFPEADIVGIVDNDSEKWGSTFEGYRIQSPDVISDLNSNTIIIASFAKQDEIFESIRHLAGEGLKIIQLASL